jgi:hypothetical protein
MFRSAWSWIVPLIGAAAAFAGVLLTTPPGFSLIIDAVVAPPRGLSADAAAYALGAAASLALMALLVLAVVCGIIDFARRRRA